LKVALLDAVPGLSGVSLFVETIDCCCLTSVDPAEIDERGSIFIFVIVRALFDWAFKNGKPMALELDYVPMPDRVTSDIRTRVWSQIKR
jgi:hypothetical protein